MLRNWMDYCVLMHHVLMYSDWMLCLACQIWYIMWTVFLHFGLYCIIPCKCPSSSLILTVGCWVLCVTAHHTKSLHIHIWLYCNSCAYSRHNTLKRYASLSAIHFPVVGLSCHFTLYNHSNQHKTDTTAIKGMNFDSKLNPNPQQELDNKLLLHCFLSITIDTVMVWTPYILCTFLI